MAIVLNGTTGIAVPLGSASAPAETNTTSSTTGIYYPTSTTLALSTNGTQALYINASQNVGIGGSTGTTTVANGLAINNATATNYPGLEIQTAGVTRMLLNANNAASYITSVSTSPLVFTTNSTEAMRIDSSGNVGIGTSSPSQKLDVNGLGRMRFSSGTGAGHWLDTIGTASRFFVGSDAAAEAWRIYDSGGGGANRIYLDSSGNVGIGTSSPSSYGILAIQKNSTTAPPYVVLQNVGTNAADTSTYTQGGVLFSAFRDVSNPAYIASITVERSSASSGSSSAGAIIFGTASTSVNPTTSVPAERMRIDSSGNLLVGGTSADAKFVTTTTTNTPAGRIYSSATSGYTSETFQVIAGQPSGTGFKVAAFYINGAAAYAAYIRGDGTIFAVSTTIQAISDERTKENIVSSNDGLNIISALRPVRFDFKEGFGNGKQNQLGFIAQEMEQVFPEAVDEWGESDDPDKPYKSVGSGALIPVLVKAIQELSAEVEALKATVGA